MTDENTDLTESLETEEVGGAEPVELESMEDSMQAVLDEIESGRSADEAEADEQVPGGEGEKAKALQPRDEQGKFKKERKGKKIVEAAELQPEPGSVAAREAAQALEPPSRWSVEGKEWFKTLSPEAQREHLASVQQIERHATKVFQDANREKAKHESINSILEHYAGKWHEDGLTIPGALAELAATRENLKTNPVETLSRIMELRGVTPEQIAQHRNGGGVSRPTQAPQQNLLTVDHIPVLLNQFQQQLRNSQAQEQNYSEFQAVLNETGPDGRYAFPELWNPDYLSRVRPLVDDLRKTQPGLGFGPALKRIVSVLRGIDGGQANGSPSPNGQRLSREQEIARVKAANGSVRGRGNALTTTQALPRPNESLEDSFAAIRAELNSRN